MIDINIKCPCCNAENTLNKNSTLCRRCSNDLEILYKIKLHSYKYRLLTIAALINNETDKAFINLKKARKLIKGI